MDASRSRKWLAWWWTVAVACAQQQDPATRPAEPAAPAPFRCRVQAANGTPLAGVSVRATLRRSGAEPVTVVAVSEGDLGVATFKPWRFGPDDKGLVELLAQMPGARPRCLVDLARRREEMPAVVLPADARPLEIEVRAADGEPLPLALRSSFRVTVVDTGPEPTVGGQPPSLLAQTDGRQRARFFPVAAGARLGVHVSGSVGTSADIEVAPSTADAAAAAAPVVVTLPDDTVVIEGTFEGADPKELLMLAVQTPTQGNTVGVGVAEGGRFAVAMRAASLEGDATWRLMTATRTGESTAAPFPKPTRPGHVDLGHVRVESALILEGIVRLDGVPAPRLALRVILEPPQRLVATLPPIATAGENGHFALRGRIPDGTRSVRVLPMDALLRAAQDYRFDVGTRDVVIDVVHPPEVSVTVLFDDAQLAQQIRDDQPAYGCSLRFPTLLTPKPGAPPGVMIGRWPGLVGGSYTLKVELVATGEVVYQRDEPVEIEKPSIAANRDLGTIDLRGVLSLLRVRAATTSADGALLFVRRPDGPWSRRILRADQLLLSAGPVDVLALGPDMQMERHSAVRGELVLAARPARAIEIRVTPPPPPGVELAIRSLHEGFHGNPEFPLDRAFTRRIDRDGKARVGRPLDAGVRLQLVRIEGGAEVEIGEPRQIDAKDDGVQEWRVAAEDYRSSR